MIRVVFTKKKNTILGFSIKGHSGYAAYGSDIVCSAVSAISQTVLIGMEEVLNLEPIYSLEEGFSSIDISKLSKEDIESCQVLMKSMELSILSMKVNYGKYIKVSEEEV